MSSHTEMFRRVTIIGVGLMGGSLGMAIKKHSLAGQVVGASLRQSSLLQAIKHGCIDEGLIDIPKAVRSADLVILAAPVDAIIKLLSVIQPHLRRGCLVTDVGSTKLEIVEAAEKKLALSEFFVGSHPLSGSEKSGVDFARAELFEGSRCIMTPTTKTNQMAKEKIKQLWARVGANVKFMSPAEHDEALAYISHLPHFLAYGLMETIPGQMMEHASQGLKDTTRIAASSPSMWGDIALANSKNIVKSMDEFIRQLAFIRKAIAHRDKKGLIQYFTRAKERRDGIL